MSARAVPLPATMTAALSALDRPDSYGLLSRVAHWGGALLTLLLLGIGLAAEDFVTSEARQRWLWAWHVGIGVFAFLPLAARVLWRVAAVAGGRGPAPLSPPGWQRLAEKAGHGALLGLLALMMVTGPLMIWSDGSPIHVLGWFTLPTPMEPNKVIHHWCGRLHALGSKLMILLVLVHLIGAVRHGAASFRRMAGRG